jgi:hypothetical protein
VSSPERTPGEVLWDAWSDALVDGTPADAALEKAAAAVIAHAWEVKRTADGHPVYYCAGCVEGPQYTDADEFWCPSCERVTTGRFE